MKKIEFLTIWFFLSFLSTQIQLGTEHIIPPVYPSFVGWTFPGEQSTYNSTQTNTNVNYTRKNGTGVVLSSDTISNTSSVEFRLLAFKVY